MNFPAQTMDLTGKVALVTGGGSGIGLASALSLARAGALVGVHYHRSRDGAQNVVQQILDAGGKAVALGGDLTQEADAYRVVDATVEAFGRLDIVVNNAGGMIRRARIEDCSWDDWKQTYDLNMTSAFLVTKRAIASLRATGSGRIINVLSLAVQTGGANGAGAYAAAKGALAVFTRTLAKELAPAVRTNSIMPGTVETQHHEVHSTPEMLENYRKQTPLGRNTFAEEVASSVVFLASDLSSHMNGALLDISGGRFLR